MKLDKMRHNVDLLDRKVVWFISLGFIDICCNVFVFIWDNWCRQGLRKQMKKPPKILIAWPFSSCQCYQTFFLRHKCFKSKVHGKKFHPVITFKWKPYGPNVVKICVRNLLILELNLCLLDKVDWKSFPGTNTSLLWKIANYWQKKFYNIWPMLECST